MFTKIVGVTAALFIAALLALASLYEAHYRPIVSVRWAAEVTPALRAELESHFGLIDPRRDDHSDTTWSYGLLHPSQRDWAALIVHPLVNDTNGIDRATGKLQALGWRDHLARALPRASLLTLILGSASALVILLKG